MLEAIFLTIHESVVHMQSIYAWLQPQVISKYSLTWTQPQVFVIHVFIIILIR